MTGGLRALGLIVVCTAACAHVPKPAAPPPPPKLPELKVRAPRPPPPAEWFWEPVDPRLHAERRKPLALPVAEQAIVRSEGATKVWSDLPPEGRERLRKAGALVVGSDNEMFAKSELSFGAFYAELAEQKVPAIVTFDALMAATRHALESALGQVEDELAPVLTAFLARLDARLESEKKGLNATLTEAYRLARGVILVARVLAESRSDPKPGEKAGAKADLKLPADLAPAVAAERALIEAHAATSTSPILGLPIEYTRFAVPTSAARPGAFRALAWLGAVPFALAGRAEHPGAPLDVAQARTATRAAMLLARLCDADVDAQTNALYTRIGRYLSFVWGPSDDLTLFDLDEIGTKAGVDLTKPEHINDVAKVDRVRAGARGRPEPALHDGPAGVGRTARVFGGHASPDGRAITALLGPAVGPAKAEAPPSIQRDGTRVIPSTLDVASWLDPGPTPAAELEAARLSAFEGFAAAHAGLLAARARPEAMDGWHATVYGSLLAAVATQASTTTTGLPERVRLEQTLSAWTELRHIDAPFAHTKPATRPSAPVSGATTAQVYVEEAPEGIAYLVGAVQQARRGLEAIGGLKDSALDDAEELLRIALKAAENRANDDAAVDAASLPPRIARLEELGEPGPIAVVVASDPPSRRVLVSATGRIEPLLLLVRDPGKEEPILVVGAHLAHHEIVTDAGEAPTDASWRAKVGPAARAPWVAAFRIVPPSRVSP